MGSYGFDGFGVMFSVVPIIIVIGFAVVFGIIIARVIKSGKEWGDNNNSPVLTVNAAIVAKRVNVSRHSSAGADHSSPSSTAYFVTFEVESGDRMEFRVQDKRYGLMVEGDTGKLTFQGTRFKDFERHMGGNINDNHKRTN